MGALDYDIFKSTPSNVMLQSTDLLKAHCSSRRHGVLQKHDLLKAFNQIAPGVWTEDQIEQVLNAYQMQNKTGEVDIADLITWIFGDDHATAMSIAEEFRSPMSIV